MVKFSSKLDLSIIVPTFNEEGGIEKTIDEIYKDATKAMVNKLLNSFEVIVVNDGSFDQTGDILIRLKKGFKDLRVVNHKFNQGLGASILTGVRYSKKTVLTYLPADGQVFLREISAGLQAVPLADFVLTYRGRRADYNPYRHLLSNTLMISMKIFFGLNYRDYNWVHIYKKDLFKRVKVKSKGVFYLAEVVARAHQAGAKIVEAEAKYHPRSSGYSKNAKLKVALATLRDMFKLWMELNWKK